MPLTEHRGFRLSILCDVFLLLSLQVETFLTAIVLNLPISSGLELNNTYNFQPILYTDDGKGKSPDKFDTYKDFNDDEIHRILRDEESAYRDEEPHVHRRAVSSGNIFYRIQKRSTNVNSVDLYFDNRNNTESSDHSTKVVDLAKKNLTQHAIDRFLIENVTDTNWSGDVVLNLSSNCLNDFRVEILKKVKNLQHLDLSWNNLTKFMLNNSSLRILNLSRNQVSNFSSTIQNNNLQELYLRNNNLSSVEHLELSKLNRLQNLDLSCNLITEVERNFFGNARTLRQLNLSKNRLGNITKDLFYNLLNIDNLILSYNNISAIDLDTFMDLPNLQYLDLSHNNIQSGSVRALQGIPDLVGLSIAYNFDLGDSLQEFVATWSLKELDVSGTGLCRIPAALAQSVRGLKLVDNWFSVVRCGDLDSYPLLQYLDLSSCHINEIEEDALGRLEILETLFLDHNNLRRVPISLPTTLAHLFLHNNQIMDIQPSTFQSLSNLRTLDLSENKLIYLPALPLPKLLTLNLQSSELRGLSQSVVKTSPKLKDLLLEGNPIKCSDLLGIAEWASPCRNDRIVQEKDIKGHFQRMHNRFQTFTSNQEAQTDCISANYRKQGRRKPKCADSNIKFIQSNKLESQLEGMEDIIASRKIIDVNLLHFLTSFLQQASEKIRSKNFTEEEQNFIQKKPEVFSRQQYNQSGTFLEDHNVTSKNFPPANENTAVRNEGAQHRSNIVGPFSGSKGGHINEKSSFEAKTPILSFSYNLYKSRGNITAQQSGGGWGKSENVTQEQQHRATLSKIKSDNNYVETSVLLGQESQAGDGINEGKLVVQVGNHDPIDSNFKSGNIDSVPKVKDNIFETILLNEQNFLDGTLGVTSLHKIDKSNTNKLEPINRGGMYSGTKNISQMGVILPENVYPSVKTQQLSENSGKRQNLSNQLSPGQQLIGIGQLIGGKDVQTINPSEIKRNSLVNNKGNRETIQIIDITTSTEMNTKTTSSDIIHLTTFGPLVTMPQKMMTLKVNKADKVVFPDRIHAMDENGIIKRKQNVARPMSQHYQQIQKIQSKATQRQHSGQLRQYGVEEMQRQQILLSTTATVHENGNNNKRQQKNRNGTLTSSHIERTSDMNRKHFKENATVTTTVDQNGHKEVVNGDKKFIKQHQRDMHNSDNLKYENQIQKGIEDKENFESSKIEQILGSGGDGAAGAVRLVSSWHQDIERTGDKFLKAVSLKKTTKFDSEKVRKKKVLHTLNTAKDSTSELSDENFSVESSVNNPFQGNTAKPETHHTVNTENLPYTPDYITSKVASLPPIGIRMQSDQFSYSYDEPSSPRTESRLKLNKEISLDRSRISNGRVAHPGVPEVLAHHVNPNSNTSSGGLPPEQLLDVRTATGHPGLFIVIGLTFGMLTALGLIHVYRCRRPFGCQCSQQFHNHTHGYSPPANGDYCNCNDEYYIEVDQESQSSVQKDFLPMELLNSNSRRSDRYMHGW